MKDVLLKTGPDLSLVSCIRLDANQFFFLVYKVPQISAQTPALSRCGSGFPGHARQAKERQPGLEEPVVDKFPALTGHYPDQLAGGNFGWLTQGAQNEAKIFELSPRFFTHHTRAGEHIGGHHAWAKPQRFTKTDSFFDKAPPLAAE